VAKIEKSCGFRFVNFCTFAPKPIQNEKISMLDEIHQKTGTGFDQGNAIRWNFGKFLGAAFVFFMKKDM